MKYEAIAKEVITKYLKKINGHARDLRGGATPESLHQIRVTCRRLQNSFWVFKTVLPRKRLKEWKNTIKKLLNQLSESRDLDVEIEFLQKFSEDLENSKYGPGLAILVELLVEKRRTVQPLNILTLDNFEKSGITRKIEKTTVKLEQKASKDTTTSTQKVFALAQERIEDRLRAMFSYEPFMYIPSRVEDLHDMRIAVKKLRYTLENLKDLYSGDIDYYIEKIRSLQRIFGTIHDYDVWIESLPPLLSSYDDESFKSSVEYFRIRIKTLRTKAYDDLLMLWRQLKEERLWYKLVTMVVAFKEDTVF